MKDFLYDFISMVIKYDCLKMNVDDFCVKDIENFLMLNRFVMLIFGELLDFVRWSLRFWILCIMYNNLFFGGFMEDILYIKKKLIM